MNTSSPSSMIQNTEALASFSPSPPISSRTLPSTMYHNRQSSFKHRHLPGSSSQHVISSSEYRHHSSHSPFNPRNAFLQSPNFSGNRSHLPSFLVLADTHGKHIEPCIETPHYSIITKYIITNCIFG